MTGGSTLNVEGGTVARNAIGAGSTTVNGGSTLNVTGGTIGGEARGGGSAVNGDAVANVSGGSVAGNVLGGGTARVTGNSAVNVASGADIAGSVFGGGSGGGTAANPSVTGDASVLITGGAIGGTVYAGGTLPTTAASVTSRVGGEATVTIQAIPVDDAFAAYAGELLPGYVLGASNAVFAADTTPYLGTIGSLADGPNGRVGFNVFSTLSFIDGSIQQLSAADVAAANWLVDTGTEVELTDAGTASVLSPKPDTANVFTLGGRLILNAAENLAATAEGDWVSHAGFLAMSANTDTDKDFLQINGSATVGSPGDTIELALDPDWDGERIDLVSSTDASDPRPSTWSPSEPTATSRISGTSPTTRAASPGTSPPRRSRRR